MLVHVNSKTSQISLSFLSVFPQIKIRNRWSHHSFSSDIFILVSVFDTHVFLCSCIQTKAHRLKKKKIRNSNYEFFFKKSKSLCEQAAHIQSAADIISTENGREIRLSFFLGTIWASGILFQSC